MAETIDGPSGTDGRMSADDIIDDKALDELLRSGAEAVGVKLPDTPGHFMNIESDLEWCSGEWCSDEELEMAQLEKGHEAPPKDSEIQTNDTMGGTVDGAAAPTQRYPVFAATTGIESEEFERLVPALKIQKTSLDAPDSTWQELEKAIRLQLQIVEAATFGLVDRFLPLLRALQKVKLSKQIMMKTGLGVLVADTRMWPEKLQPEAKALEMTWRKAQRQMNPVYGIENVHIHTEMVPWNNQKRELFVDKASNMATYMKLNDDVKAAPEIYKLAGLRLALNGYNDIRELDSVVAQDISPAVANTAVRMAICRAIALQTRLGNATRSRRVQIALEQAEVATRVRHINGEQVAANVAKNAQADALDKIDEKFEEFGVQRTKDRPKPRSLIKDLNKVVANHGHSKVEELLNEKVAVVRGFNWKGSWRSIQSGIRLWVAFATGFLGYDMPSCIPPSCSEHVQKYIATMFTNPGTASNYVYYLRVACSEVGDNKMAWDDYGVQVALKGVKKINMQLWGGPSRIAWLMTNVWVISLMMYNISAGRPRMALAHLFNYDFLLRTQSEGLSVWKGSMNDVKDGQQNIQSFRQNGVFICEDATKKKELVFVMKTRKNRPRGSVLRRQCYCPARKDDKTKSCMVCRMEVLIADITVDEVVWTFAAQQFLKTTREQLARIGCGDGARLMTFKAYRGGKATDLAKAGVSLGYICKEAEWKQSAGAWDRYLDEDKVDPAKIIDAMFELSDNEDE